MNSEEITEAAGEALDTPFNFVYAIFLAIWATVMMEVWKRRESELAHIWRMKGYIGNDAERPDFKYEYVVDKVTSKHKKVSFINSYLRRLLVELPVVIFSYGAVIGVYIGFYYWNEKYKNNLVKSLLGTVVYALIIVILGVIYKFVSSLLTNWENHRFWE